MADWIWLVVALGIGLPLLVGAAALDRRRRRRTQGPPAEEAGSPGMPRYLTQEDIDALPSPAGPADVRDRNGRAFGFGYAHPDFCTHGRSAQWDNATVLVVDDELSSLRLLIEPLRWATPEAPLVVVASAIAPEVTQALAANRRALRLPVLACIASPEDLREVARWCGATSLFSSDLAAGYLPASARGAARRWISDPYRSWVEPAPPHVE